MSRFRLLHLRRLFEHKFRSVLSISGIAIGSALVVAVLGLFGSIDGSAVGLAQDLAGIADLEVSGVSNEGFDQALLFKIEDTEGVDAAVPMIRTFVRINDRQALLIGLDQRAEKLGTRLSAAEADRMRTRATEAGVFLGEGLASKLGVREGETVKIFSAAGEVRQKMLGVIRGDPAEINQGVFAAAALPIAQQIAGKTGRLDSVLVVAKKAVSLSELAGRLAPAVGASAVVDSPARRAEQAKLATQQLRGAMLMGVGMAVVVGGFLIFITMNMAASERRRELATLRALGGRKGLLLRLFLLEAATIGLIGSAAGSLLGLTISRRLVESIPAFFAQAVGAEIGFRMPASAVPMALGIGVLASVVAALLPARRAVGVSPVESMRPEGVLESLEGADHIAPVPSIIGIAMIAGGLTLSLFGPPSIGFSGLGLVLGGIILGSYGLTAPIVRATASVASMLGVGGRLGAAALQRSPRRSWATSAAVLLATGLIAGQGGIFINLNDSIQKNLGSLGKIDLYASAPGSTSGIAPEVQLPGQWRENLAAIPGVAEVGTNTFFFMTFRKQRVLLQGLSGAASMAEVAPALVGASPEVVAAVESGKAAVVSTRFADLYGIGKGEVLELPSPTGLHHVKVAHTAPSFAWERGLVTLSRRSLVEWFGHTTVSDFGITLASGADAGRVRAEVERFVSGAPITVDVYTGQQGVESIFATVNQINSLFRAMTWVVVGAAMLAILNSLLISVAARKRELGIMRAIGTSRRQLKRMVGLEAASIGVVGGAVGGLIGFVVHRTALASINSQTGFPIVYEFVVRPSLFAFAIGVAIAVAGSILPARRAGAVNIIEAIGYE